MARPALAAASSITTRPAAAIERLAARPEALPSHAEAVASLELQQRVLRAMGHVALTRLDRLAPARSAYERLFDLAPEDADAAGLVAEKRVERAPHFGGSDRFEIQYGGRASPGGRPQHADIWPARQGRNDKLKSRCARDL